MTNIAKMLIQNGANVNAQNSSGDTTLHYTYSGNINFQEIHIFNSKHFE